MSELRKFVVIVTAPQMRASVPIESTSHSEAWRTVVEARRAGEPLLHRQDGRIDGIFLDGPCLVTIMAAEDFEALQRQQQIAAPANFAPPQAIIPPRGSRRR